MTHVLVADDDADIRELIVLRLTSLGHEVTQVRDGRAAMEEIAHTSFDLAVLDVMMPQLSGLEVLRLLRRDPARSHLPVLMISAAAEASPELRMAGPDLFLSKPFSLRSFGEAVSGLLTAD